MPSVVGKEPCPKCREEGGDSSGDNLVRYDNGTAFCFKCKYSERSDAQISSAPRSKSKLTLEQVAVYPSGCDPKRKLLQSVVEDYEVRSIHSTTDGTVEKVIYPYFDSSGGLVGAKIKRLEDKAFSVTGTLDTFFGRKTCKGSPVLIITEGEEDALAVKSILRDPKFGAAKEYDVVSLPNGASSSKSVRGHTEFLSKYKRVYLCMDADAAGEKHTPEIADWLSTLTDTYTVQLDPSIGKDASDYLMADKGREFRFALKGATKYEPEGVVEGSEIDLDWLLEPLPEGYPIPYPGLQDKLHGLRKAEITTICAGSGIGKSTLCRELAKSLIEGGKSVAYVALEDQMQVTAQALIALDMNIPLNKFRFSPPDKSDVQPSYDKMIANGKTYFYKHFGGLNAKSLMDRLYYYARSKGVDYIVLDHLSIVVSATDTTNERKAIDTLMTELAKLVVETGVGLIQVVHLKRPGGDKSFAHGAEVELSDLRGSAALEQLSWTVIGLERDQQGDDADFSRVRLLKNRTFGFTGLCDSLRYNTSTGRLEHYVPPSVGEPPTDEEYDETVA